MPDQTTIAEIKPSSQAKAPDIVPFKSTLARHNLKLGRQTTATLQINLGFLCNQTCRHCHLNAGPGRKENMDAQTLKAVVAYAQRCRFAAIDITGGAPELNPLLPDLIQQIAPLAPRIMLRSNLSALHQNFDRLMGVLKYHRVVIVASFPSLNLSQMDAQRGEGIFKESIAVLKALNAMLTEASWPWLAANPPLVAVAVSGGLTFASIEAGFNHSCGLTVTGDGYSRIEGNRW